MVVGQAVNDRPQLVRTGMMASDTMVRSAYLPYWASAVLATLGSWACSWTSASASVLAGSMSGIARLLGPRRTSHPASLPDRSDEQAGELPGRPCGQLGAHDGYRVVVDAYGDGDSVEVGD